MFFKFTFAHAKYMQILVVWRTKYEINFRKFAHNFTTAYILNI